MRSTFRSVFLVVGVGCVTGLARAQAAPPAAPPAAPGPGGATAAPSPIDLPPPPDVKDPMLEPIPDAPNALASWRDAVRLVRQRSTTLKISRAEIAQAEGATREVWAKTLPTLTGTARLTRHLLYGTATSSFTPPPTAAVPNPQPITISRTVPDPGTTFGAGLDFRQPLLAMNTWEAIGASRLRERAAELSSKDAQRLLLAAVADAAVTVITTARVAESARVGLKSALSTLDLTQRRAALGAASAVDVLRAEQEVALARSVVVTSDESLRRAREALGTSLGDTTPWGVAPSVKVEELVQTASEVCQPVPSIDSRADIQAAQGGVDAAARDRANIDYTYVPTVDFVSSLDYAASARTSPNQEHLAWSAGAVLNWPLYDGGDRYGQKRQREAQETIAREQLTQKRRDATLEVAQATRAITVAEANLAVAVQTRDLAEKSARLARIAFTSGTGTSFDLVDNARRLREAEIDLLIKNFEVIKARITAHIAQANCSI